jgi:hypothetical protein
VIPGPGTGSRGSGPTAATVDAGPGGFSRWPTPVLLVAFLAIAVPLAIQVTVWRDEAYSLVTTARSLGFAASNAVGFERQAPLYFIVLWLWRVVCPAPEYARLLSVACIAATIPVAGAIARRLFPRMHPAWFAALIASSPVAWFAALEIRVYALALLLSSLLILTFLGAFVSTGSRRAPWLAFVAAAVASLYTYYYLGFLLSAGALALGFARRWNDLVRYGAALGVVAVLCLPILTWLPDQVRHPSAGAQVEKSAAEVIQDFGRRTEAYVIPANRLVDRLDSETGIRVLRWALRAGAVLALVLLLRGRRSAPRHEDGTVLIAIWVLLAGVAIQFAVAGSVLGGHLIATRRYTDILVIPALLGLMSLLGGFARPGVRAALLAALVAANVADLWCTYRPPLTRTGDGKRIAAYLMQRERPGQAVAVFPNENVLVLEHYYRGPNPVFGIPRPVSLDVFEPQRTAFDTEAEVLETLERRAPGRRELWLVREEIEEYLGVDYRTEVLDAVIEKYFRTVQRERFFESEVRLLQRR